MNISSSTRKWNRRTFVKLTAAATVTTGLAPHQIWGETTKSGGVPLRPLGSTGVRVSALGLGGYHIGVPDTEAESTTLIRAAIDQGITFMDNSWDYHDGGSEIRMGKALRDGYRDKVFLMTKIDARTKANAEKQIHECLARLQTDRLDLLQFHEILWPKNAGQVFAPGGALEAVVAAQKAGKVRFIGFTGHKDPSAHLHMLEVAAKNNFKFDTVQMPLNVMDAHFRSFEHQVLPVLVRDKIGALAMKTLGGGNILRSRLVTATECLHYALNLPASVVIAGIENLAQLKQAVDAMATFKPLGEADVASLLARTAEAANSGQYEPFKTSTAYDSLVQKPENYK